MKRTLLASLVLALVAGGTITANAKKPAAAMANGAMSPPALTLHDGMRTLWTEHVVYTRNFIISALAGLEDTPKVTERLLRNQDDIGNAIKPVYGDAAAKKLTALLRDHILIAADIVKAAKANDHAGVTAGEKKWHANADELATFLSGANPNWAKPELTQMLYKHLDLTTTEVVSRIKKDWAADIAAYDKGYEHMMMFADLLTNGILKQHPDKFASL